jgi:death-on-curing protein
MTREPIWIHGSTIRQIHRLQIATFGGLDGIRDERMLESALARPVNLWLYEQASVFELAAAYGFGMAMNHLFIDGNKRTALVVSVLFIELNGFKFNASEIDATTTFYSLAAGELREPQLSEWFAQWSIGQEAT